MLNACSPILLLFLGVHYNGIINKVFALASPHVPLLLAILEVENASKYTDLGQKALSLIFAWSILCIQVTILTHYTSWFIAHQFTCDELWLSSMKARKFQCNNDMSAANFLLPFPLQFYGILLKRGMIILNRNLEI